MVLLGANDKIAESIKETFLQQKLNLGHVVFSVHTAEGLHSNVSSN